MWNIFLLTEPAEIQTYDCFSLHLQIFKRPETKNKTTEQNKKTH